MSGPQFTAAAGAAMTAGSIKLLDLLQEMKERSQYARETRDMDALESLANAGIDGLTANMGMIGGMLSAVNKTQIDDLVGYEIAENLATALIIEQQHSENLEKRIKELESQGPRASNSSGQASSDLLDIETVEQRERTLIGKHFLEMKKIQRRELILKESLLKAEQKLHRIANGWTLEQVQEAEERDKQENLDEFYKNDLKDFYESIKAIPDDYLIKYPSMVALEEAHREGADLKEHLSVLSQELERLYRVLDQCGTHSMGHLIRMRWVYESLGVDLSKEINGNHVFLPWITQEHMQTLQARIDEHKAQADQQAKALEDGPPDFGPIDLDDEFA